MADKQSWSGWCQKRPPKEYRAEGKTAKGEPWFAEINEIGDFLCGGKDLYIWRVMVLRDENRNGYSRLAGEFDLRLAVSLEEAKKRCAAALRSEGTELLSA